MSNGMMVRIDPPDGTIMHLDYYDERMSGRAGLKFACYHTVSLMDGSQREVPGTVLRYEPNGLQIWVARRELTGDEINRIGQLGQRLYAIRRQRDYVPDALIDLERFVRNMNGFNEMEGIEEELKAGGEKIVAEIGTLAPILRNSDLRLAPQEESIAVEFYMLGVTCVRSCSWLAFDRAIRPPS